MVDSKKFIGRELGNVTILKELGRGNKGIVFIAFQKSLKRQVAVKILLKSSTDNEEIRQQFLDEGEIVAGLSHPNIIPIFEIGENKEFYYQVMQFINGSDLNVLIKKHMKHPVPSKRVIPIEQTIDIILQILAGLGYAHDEGIVHQDMKPGNVLMESRTKRPLIADFGIAKTAQMEYKNQKDIITGTPLYLSPEQAAAKETDKRTDIYSVGVILFKMLVGMLPHRNESVERIILRKINEPETFFTALPSAVSNIVNDDLEEIIVKATKPDPDERYQDCFVFKDRLIWFRKKHLVSLPDTSPGR